MNYFPTISTALVVLSACAHGGSTTAPAVSEPQVSPAMPQASLVRTVLVDTEFQPLFPGVSVHFIYGGMGLGVPTAQVGRIDAGLTFPAHHHSGDYYAVVVQGRFQHWEAGDPDQGPVMTPGSTFFQGKDAPHYDSCLGPEQCLVFVTFPERADVTVVQ